MPEQKTITVDVVADPEHLEALQTLIADIAIAFRRLGGLVDDALRSYRLVLEELDLPDTD